MKKLEEFVSAVVLLKEAGIKFTPEQALKILNRVQWLADEAKGDQGEVGEQLGRIIETVAGEEREV